MTRFSGTLARPLPSRYGRPAPGTVRRGPPSVGAVPDWLPGVAAFFAPGASSIVTTYLFATCCRVSERRISPPRGAAVHARPSPRSQGR